MSIFDTYSQANYSPRPRTAHCTEFTANLWPSHPPAGWTLAKHPSQRQLTPRHLRENSETCALATSGTFLTQEEIMILVYILEHAAIVTQKQRGL